VVLVNILIALFITSTGSASFVALMLLLKKKNLESICTYYMYLAGGTLLGAAFLGMIPTAISKTDPKHIFQAILLGILFFFILEKFILWRSCGDKNCERHMKAAVPIILIGDIFHNAIDGVVVAAAFLTSTEFGIFTTFAIVLHDIPADLADFGILIKSGLSRRKAFWLNILGGSTAIISGVITFYTLSLAKSSIPYALAFAASSFIYIALADLVPEMHRKASLKDAFKQIILIFSGVLIVYLITNIK